MAGYVPYAKRIPSMLSDLCSLWYFKVCHQETWTLAILQSPGRELKGKINPLTWHRMWLQFAS